MPVLIDFRKVLSYKIKETGTTQGTLSKSTGVRAAAISNFLNGKANLRSDQLEKLLNYLYSI